MPEMPERVDVGESIVAEWKGKGDRRICVAEGGSDELVERRVAMIEIKSHHIEAARIKESREKEGQKEWMEVELVGRMIQI